MTTDTITLSKTTLGLLNNLISDALHAGDDEATRHSCICAAHEILNPDQWRTLTAAESLAMAANEPDLIEQLRQSRLCIEGEAHSTGQMHAQRLLTQSPDYGLLMQMVDAVHSYESSNVVDLGSIIDDYFKSSLSEYPNYLTGHVFAGFFDEVARIHREVTLDENDQLDHQLAEELAER